ncbi:MAG: non-ribosomal peptide synthase/polyketide synthase [Acidobacteriota bacterium]|nr:non-ribosomal peptide synthase/polyketide synthase [Acidobacteriota bacterium]
MHEDRPTSKTVGGRQQPPDKLRERLRRARARLSTTGTIDAHPRHPGETMPLSLAQERLWFLDQLLPGTALFLLCRSQRLQGSLDVGALELALRRLLERHEILRTAFVAEEGTPRQRPRSLEELDAELGLPVVDLRGLPEDAREVERRRIEGREARRPMDPRRAPLLRWRLLRLGPRDHVLLFTLHHLVFDGWSFSVLFHDLAACYRSESCGEPGLEPLPIQFADFARWERQEVGSPQLQEVGSQQLNGQRPGQRIEEGAGAEELAWWVRRLEGLEPLELPADRPRSAERGLDAGQLAVALPRDLVQRLEERGAQNGASLFMELLAAWTAVLMQWAGRSDVAVGTPVAGRGRRELEKLVGFFVNTVVLRCDGGGDPSLDELLERCREVTLESLARAEVPFARVVQAVAPERGLGHAPLYQVTLSLENTSPRSTGLQLPGVEAAPLEVVPRGLTDQDLTLALQPGVLQSGVLQSGALQSGDGRVGLTGALLYRRDLFDSTTVLRLLGHWRRVLESLVDEPDLRLSQLSLLTSGEHHQLLWEWASGAGRGLEARAEQTVLHRVLAQARQQPEAVAVVGADGTTLSYGELEERSRCWGAWLRRRAVHPGVPVALCLGRSEALAVAALAVWRAGGAYLPMDPSHPPQRLAFMAADAGASLALVEPAASPELRSALAESGVAAAAIDAYEPPAGMGDPALPLQVPQPESRPEPRDPAYLIYTSGSTGRPKGTLLTHGGLEALVAWHGEAHGVGPESRCTLLAGTGFDASVWELWSALGLGASLAVVPPETAASPQCLAELFRRRRITHTFLPTPLAEALLDELVAEAAPPLSESGEPLVVLTGGDRLRRRPAAGAPLRLVNHYGPTEATVVATWGTVAPEAGSSSSLLPTIGRPLPALEARVVGLGLELLPVGVPGELVLGGAGLALGYLRRPAATAAAFVPDPWALEPGARIYRTGDRVRWTPVGELEFLGRGDDQVKVRGFRIELGEIEAALAALPQVTAAAVLAQRGPAGVQLVAYVCPRDDVLDRAELERSLAEGLPEYMVPTAWVPLEEMPLTANGKIDRRRLAALEAPRAEPASRQPLGIWEELVAACFQQLLEVDAVHADDDFFALGGHSLLATRLVARVAEATGAILTLEDLFRAPTVAGLAAILEREQQSGDAAVADRPQPDIRVVPRTVDSLPMTLPASPAQHSLWLAEQLEEGSAAYAVPLAVELRGRLDVRRLVASLEAAVRRHETLRTTLRLEAGVPGGMPVQEIHPPAPVVLPCLDLQGLGAEAAVHAQELAEAWVRRPWDLRRGPLWRGLLLRRGGVDSPADHLLVLSLHHIIADGWSVGVLLDELGRGYGSGSSAAALPDLPMQFADFAAWQQRRLELAAGEASAAELAWWREELEGIEVLELPADRPRPPRHSVAGARWPVRYGPRVTGALQGLADRAGGTLFLAVLAVLQGWLYRLTGCMDFAVGSPEAGRDLAGVEGLIGYFVHLLVLRGRISGEESLEQRLASARERMVRAYGHRHTPFHRLVEELSEDRDAAHTPLFQVLLAMDGGAPAERTWGDGDRLLEVRPVAVETGISKFDLSLALSRRGDELVGHWVYSTALFDRTTIQRWAVSWGRWALAAADGEALDRILLLAPAEAHQLLVEWNRGREEYLSNGLAGESAFELVAAAGMETPEAPALVFEGESYSYAELLEGARTLAGELRRLGVGADRLVAVCAERSPVQVMALLAVLAAGGGYLPLDPELPAERLELMIRDSAPVLALADGRGRGLLAEISRGDGGLTLPILALEEWDFGQRREGREEGVPPGLPRACPLGLAYVIYTSGSTGRPKGVMISHGALANRLRYARALDFRSDDAFLHKTTLAFDVSVLEIFGPLVAGGRVVMARPGGQQDAEYLTRLIADQGVTQASFPPTLLEALLASPRVEEMGTLRTVITGGETVSADLPGRFYPRLDADLLNRYGPTETTVSVTSWRCRRRGEKPLPIGRATAGTRLYVLDAGLRPLPQGAVGELCLGGPGVARGYSGRPADSAGVFVPDPFSSQPGSRMYRSGDLVRWRHDGALEFVGRADGQVKVRGFRIELGEVEAALRGLPAVGDAVVVPQGAGARRRLVAFIVPLVEGPPASGGRPFEGDGWAETLRARLPEYMVPSALVTLEAFPLTPSGKVDRRALSRRAPEPEAAPYRPPVTDLECRLAAAWREVLGLPRVGLDDDFFDLGGHSLLATRLVSRLRELLRMELPLRALFEARTVARLAAHIEALEASPERAEGAGEEELRPRPPGEDAPLSFAQERLWFLDRLDPGSTAYTLRGALRLGAAVNAGRLAAALGRVAVRQESLRTVFLERRGATKEVGDGAVQRVLPAPRVWRPLPLVDLRRLPEAGRRRELVRLADADAARPFDLGRGPLWRFVLVRLQGGPGGEGESHRHTLLVTHHHIVSDGWSNRVLARELDACYGALERGEEPALPPLPIQYGDFAAWQRRWAAGPALQRQREYWRRELAGAEVLGLPTDRPRPPVQSLRGADLVSELDESLTEGLEELARSCDGTLFMVLLAALQGVLARYGAAREVTAGTFIAGRNRRALEPLIGFFINHLALRTDLSGDPPVRELLGRVRDVTLGAYAHQDLPFERVIEAVGPPRDPSRTPIFQVALLLQNLPTVPPGALEARWERLEEGAERSEFDLTLVAGRPDGAAGERPRGGLKLRLIYSAELFDPSTARRLLEGLRRWLASAVEEPQQRLSRLPLLSASEEHQLLWEWAAGGAREELAAGAEETSLHGLVFAAAARAPAATAVAWPDGQPALTYGELARRATALARRLEASGEISPDTIVGLCIGPRPELSVAMLGVLEAGAAYLPLDPTYPPERLRLMLEDSAAAAVLCTADQEDDLDRLTSLPRWVVALDGGDEDGQPRNGARPVHPRQLAYIIYTSGSTGRPKGVAVDQANISRYARAAAALHGLSPEDRSLQLASICFDASAEEIWPCLITGATLVLRGPVILDSPAAFLEACTGAGLTVVDIPTAFWQELILALEEQPSLRLPPALRLVIIGGEAARPDSVERWRRVAGASVGLLNTYGPTETTVVASTWRGGALPAGQPVPIGEPLVGTRVFVTDAYQLLVPEGALGELLIGGDGVSRGYLGRPRLTAERFVPNPWPDSSCGERGGRLYRSGDLVRWRRGGVLEYLGRIDRQIKVRGFRVEPGEIEAALADHPGVSGAAVDVDSAGRLVAWLVPVATAPLSTDELRSWLSARMPEHLVPSFFVPLEHFPLTRSGKVDRRALPAPATVEPEGQRSRPPANPLEELLVDLWGEVLELDTAGVDDDFFAVGGHSLLATRVVSRLRRRLEVELPLRQLFETPTPARLAPVLAELLAEEPAGDSLEEAPALVPVSRDQPLELSFAQQRLWFLDRFEPGAAYNIPAAVRLRGELAPRALSRALTAIVGRHESLRTVFYQEEQDSGSGGASEDPGRPLQRILEPVVVVPPLVDLTRLAPDGRERELQRLALSETRRPFRLTRGPLYRFLVFRLGTQHHAFLFDFHHSIADGWSVGIFLRELEVLYAASLEGDPPHFLPLQPLPPLPVQYADFAAWQRRWLSGSVLEEQLAFWRRQLEGVPVLELPTDRSRPLRRNQRGGGARLELSAETTAAVHALARNLGATPFMVLLAAFYGLLARLSGQRDLAVGTPIACRTREELEGLVGFFANTLVLRADLSSSPSLEEMILAVRRQSLGAYAHQEVPFEKLVEELAPRRDLVHTPLFQVMFILQNASTRRLRLAGLETERLPLRATTAKFDLTFALQERDDHIEGAVEYDADLFHRSTVQRFARLYEGLLAAALEEPGRSLLKLSWLGAAERQQLLIEWQGAPAPMPDRQGETLDQLFAEWVRRWPEESALAAAAETLSYSELERRSASLARKLRGRGVGPDVVVGLCLERSPRALVAMLAVLRAGGCYLPLDPSYPPERLAFMVRDSGAILVLVEEATVSLMPEEVPRLLAATMEESGSTEETSPQVLEGALESGCRPENLAYLIYTSGSTGRPKGVAMPHGPLVNLLDWQLRRSLGDRARGSRTLQFVPLSFDVHFQEVFATWGCGGTVVLVPEEARRDGALLLRELEEQRVNRLFLPFVALQMLAEVARETGKGAPSSLWEVVTAGEQLQATDAVRAFFARRDAQEPASLENQYGPSECHAVTGLRLGADSALWPALPSIGWPVDGCIPRVLDGMGAITPIGVPGELFVGGLLPARGYHRRPRRTAEAFGPDPYAKTPGARLYRTGDLVRWLPDGTLDFLGRRDAQVKVRGYRIETGEVEAALTAQPAVREAAVVVQDGPAGKRLVAWAVVSEESAGAGEALAEELLAALRQRLLEPMVPSAVGFLAELPRTPSGKVARRKLAERELDREAAEGRPPRGPLEELIAGQWAQLLGRTAITAEDDFFALGGHSLLATRAATRLGQALGVEVPVRALFEAPTVARLAVWAEAALAAEERVAPLPPLVGCQGPGDAPASYGQRRMWFLHRLDPESPAYNVPTQLCLRGALAVAVLARALGELVRRHGSLRTVFVPMADAEMEGAEDVAQRVLEPPPEGWAANLPVVDLGALGPVVAEEEARRLARREVTRPFDLERGPVTRWLLLRRWDPSSAEPVHDLLLDQHHIISDAWSVGLVLKELASLYNAFRRDEPSPLRALSVDYAAYARWQREALGGEALERRLEPWRRRLAGAPVLELPTDRPRPSVRSQHGAALRWWLAPAVVEGLESLAQRSGATLYMVLLAGFQALLGRLTGQQDLTVGTPVAGRTVPEVEPLLGFFVNTLVLRANLGPEPATDPSAGPSGPGFEELIQRTRGETLDAFAGQEVPFERLVEELVPRRDLAFTPLFQALFALQTAAQELPRLDGLATSWGIGESGAAVARFDLSCIFWRSPTPGDERLAGLLEYSTDLFDATTVQRFATSFGRLLTAAVAEPGLSIERLPLLSSAQVHQLRVEWNDTASRYPREGDLIAELHRVAQRQPEASALETAAVAGPKRVISYGTLRASANALAHRLRSLGVGAGGGAEAPVALLLERSPEAILAILATVEAGGVYVPLDPGYPPERLGWLLGDVAPAVILTGSAEESPAEKLGWSGPVIELDVATCWSPSVPIRPLPAAAPEQLAYITYTSGSTGRPKGVAVTRRGVLRLAVDPDFLELGPGQSVLQLAPLPFDATTAEVWCALLHGARLVLAPAETLSLEQLGSLIEDERVDTLWLTAGLFHQMIDAVPERLTGLRQLLAGGDVVSPAHVRRTLEKLPECRIRNCYGPTENTTFTTTAAICGPADLRETVPIGRPVVDTGVRILDRALEPAPPGVVGELWATGDGLARGYHRRPGLTASRFLPLPDSGSSGAGGGERMYRTGDLARWLPDGRLEFLGRRDGQVKIRGFRIELGEVEAALLQHPAVVSAVVLAVGSGADDKRLVAFVVPSGSVPSEGSGAAAELLEFLRGRLPAYLVPALCAFLDELPLTAHDKVDRRALLQRAEELGRETAGSEYRAPASVLEARLVDLFASVLNLPAVGVDDDFFELGGHSLLATRLVSRARVVLGIDLPLTAVFHAPTVAQLAEVLDREEKPEDDIPPLIPEADPNAPAPLSFAQQRMWFLHQLEPQSTAWGLPVAVRLRGDEDRGALDLRAMGLAWGELERRQQVLRTIFPVVDGEPVQELQPARRWGLPSLVDLAGLPQPVREDLAAGLVKRLLSIPFDLSRGPVWHALLVGLGPEEHLLAVTQHHIITDGWSLSLLLSQLGELYGSFARERQVPEPVEPFEPVVQYRDFARWQRGWLQGEALERRLSFWRRRLADPPVLELPMDRSRPAVRSSAGAVHRLRLGAGLVERLESLGRRRGATLFMVLLSGFQVLLARLSGQQDFTVGTPVAGRDRRELEELLGLLVDTAVIRADMGEAPTLESVVERVKVQVLEAFEHQDLPFERLLEELAPERDLAHTPLFQVLFILQNAVATHGRRPAWAGLEAAPSGAILDVNSAVQDLTVVWVPRKNGLEGSFEYSTALFDATTVARWGWAYRRVLEVMVEDPSRPVAEVCWMSPGQRHQLTVEWNDTASASPELLPRRFRSVAARHPERAALWAGDRSLSYGELDERAAHWARELRARGLTRGAKVAVLGLRTPELVASLLGVLEAGAAYLPLDPDFPVRRLAWMVEDGGPELVLVDPSLEELLDEIVAAAGAGDLPRVSLGGGAARPPTRSELCSEDLTGEGLDGEDLVGEDLAYILYTSGSTGRPKGVEVRHGGLANLLATMARRPGLAPGERLLAVTTLSFDIAALELFLPLWQGGEVVLATREDAVDPRRLSNLVQDFDVDVLQATPSTWRMLTSSGWPGRSRRSGESGLRAWAGGEALPPELMEELTERCDEVWNVYGPTETTIWSTAEAIGPESLGCGRVSVGRPVANTQVLIADGRLQPVPLGVTGELFLGGAGVTRGYRGRGDLTAERFVPAPDALAAGKPGARLYRTGDLARWLPDGRLDFLGRRDQQVKVRGYRIELGEIEAALEACEEISQAAVVVHGAGSDGQLVAYAVADAEQAPPSPSALLERVAEALPTYMVPARLVWWEALPTTPNGKVDRRLLSRQPLDLDEPMPEAKQPPRDRIEAVVAGAFEKVLEIRPVGVNDDFFRMGGHSLLAVRLLSMIEAELGREIPMAELFRHSTVEGLALWLRRELPATEPTLVPLASGGVGVPIFLVHPVGGTVLCYAELARHLGERHPVFGLQARGLDGEEPPRDRVETMAEAYLDEVLAVAPEGPWVFGGWSMGGAVAWEMAAQLVRRGRQPGPVVLLDSRIAEEDEPVPTLEEVDRALLAHLLQSATSLPEGAGSAGLEEGSREQRLERLLEAARQGGAFPPDVDRRRVALLTQAMGRHLEALYRYRPQPQELEAWLLRATAPPPPGTPDHGDLWRQIARKGFHEVQVSGDHFSILRGDSAVRIARELLERLAR